LVKLGDLSARDKNSLFEDARGWVPASDREGGTVMTDPNPIYTALMAEREAAEAAEPEVVEESQQAER
jgi:hypothetical protein